MEPKYNSKHSDYFNRKIIETGIAAGVLFLLFSSLSYAFKFLKWNPFSLLSATFSSPVAKYGISFLGAIFVSILLSILYNIFLKKRKPFLSGIILSFFFFAISLFFINDGLLNLVTVFSLILGYCLFISITISWIDEQGK